MTTSDSGVYQAVEVLRVYLATLPSPHRGSEISALVNLVYQDRLNTPPLDHGDPQAAITETCKRFSDILDDHLLLSTILLSLAVRVTGRSPEQILEDAIQGHPQGND